MRRKRKRIRYYGGETTRGSLRDKVWLPFVIVMASALILALIVGAILGSLADSARLSGVPHKDLADFGGVEKPADKFGGLAALQGDVIDLSGLGKSDLRHSVSELADGNVVAFPLYDGEGGVYFDASLLKKSNVPFTVKSSLSAEELVDTVSGAERRSVGIFVTAAFRETDEQLRVLKISEEIALLQEIAEMGIGEVVLVGLPSDSDTVTAVNNYIRQASEACRDTLLAVAVSSKDVASSDISRLVACTEAHVDAYYLDLRDVSASQLGGYLEKSAYFLTTYRMRPLVRGEERKKLVETMEIYGLESYLIEQ